MAKLRDQLVTAGRNFGCLLFVCQLREDLHLGCLLLDSSQLYCSLGAARSMSQAASAFSVPMLERQQACLARLANAQVTTGK
jgi:hypothetical protein